MAQVEDLNQYIQLTEQLVSVASKEDLAEALRLVAMQAAHYQSKYGGLPVEETLEIAHSEDHIHAQLQLTADGMEIMLGVLGSVVQGFEPPNSH